MTENKKKNWKKQKQFFDHANVCTCMHPLVEIHNNHMFSFSKTFYYFHF